MDFGGNDPHVQNSPLGATVVTYNLKTVRLHTYVAPENSFGNATHIVEGPNYLTIIDTQYAVPYSKEFRSYADSLGKEIAGVIISHAHPDHYFGLTSSFSDVPSYALVETIADIRARGPAMIAEAKKTMGSMVPDHVTVPTNVLHLGDVMVDGIRYRFTKYDKAEDDTQVVIELPLYTVIVQDAVYNNYHPWMGPYTDHWIKVLEDFEKDYSNYSLILVGHGMPATPSIFPQMKQYLTTANNIIKESGDNKEMIERKLVEAYPSRMGRMIIPIYLDYMFPKTGLEEPSIISLIPNVDPEQKPGEPTDPPSERQLNDLSKYFAKDLKKFYKFRGVYMWEWGWLLWLQENLKGAAMCVWKGPRHEEGFFYDDRTGKLTVKDWALQAVLNCALRYRVRFVVGILAVKTEDGDYHANALIFDTENQRLTRFEPHGGETTSYNMEKLDSAMEHWLSQNEYKLGGGDEGYMGWESGSTWQYNKPPNFCPREGPQSLENWRLVEEAFKTRMVFGKEVRMETGGFCSAWSLLYIHLRITNPDATDKEISEYLVGLGDKKLSFMIREYAEFIVSRVDPTWVAAEKRAAFSVGDYFEMRDRPGNLTGLGRILRIDQTTALTWRSYRGKRARYKFDPVNVRLTDLEPISSEKLRERIDRDIPVQLANPITSTGRTRKNWGSWVTKNKELLEQVMPEYKGKW